MRQFFTTEATLVEGDAREILSSPGSPRNLRSKESSLYGHHEISTIMVSRFAPASRTRRTRKRPYLSEETSLGVNCAELQSH